MSTIEFNIGLCTKDNLGGDNVRDLRANAALRTLRNVYGLTVLRSGRTEAVYEHDSDVVAEDTLVVEVRAEGWLLANLNAVEAVTFRVAEATEQEAVAAYIPGRDFGLLAGRSAAAWGDFDPNFFVRIDAVAPAIAQAA